MDIILCTKEFADEHSLMHYRTKGSRNGFRRYQNEDGSLTAEGYRHYGIGEGRQPAGVPRLVPQQRQQPRVLAGPVANNGRILPPGQVRAASQPQAGAIRSNSPALRRGATGQNIQAPGLIRSQANAPVQSRITQNQGNVRILNRPGQNPGNAQTNGQKQGDLQSRYAQKIATPEERKNSRVTLGAHVSGQYGRGNIDLNNRKVVRNKDGSVSTEKSFSVNIDGKETLLPTVIDGKVVSEDEAVEHYLKTGEHLGQFDTVEEADAYAEALHNRQDWYYNQGGKELMEKQQKELEEKQKAKAKSRR
jgi:hypothetical protein